MIPLSGTVPRMTPAALPEMRRQLVQARDEQMAQVVALVDALPRRGQADALIAPLRPRLALLAPNRPMTLMRLLFRPLDPVILPAPRWRPGLPAVPRTALGCMGSAVMPRLGAAGTTAQAILAGVPPGAAPEVARDAAARAGAVLWPAAASALDGLLTPPDWTEATGLPLACFAPICATVAAVLHQAVQLARLDPGPDADAGGDLAAGINAILAEAQARPAGLATVLAVLTSYGPAAAVLAGAVSGSLPSGAAGGLAALPPGALDAAVEQSLDRAGRLLDNVLPAVGLAAAAGHAADVAALVDALEHPASRPALRAQAGRTRQAADQACRDRMAQAVQQDLLPRLQGSMPGGAPLDDAAVDRLEGVARDLRRLGRAGRRLGQHAAYDALLARIAGEVGTLCAPGLTRMDRLRLAELLVGARAALRLVPEDDPT